jgi:ABC-2 type transport system permease protein
MKKSKSIVVSIARKEFLHIIRDPRSLAILFLMPILQLVLFGFALKMEIQEIKLGIVDFSRSTQSTNFIESFSGSDFFKPFYYKGAIGNIDELFKNRTAQAVMVIPEDFDRTLRRQSNTPVQFLIDASDANAATMIRSYISQVILNFNEQNNRVLPIPFDFRSTIFYNPDRKSTYFFVPGIIALLLVMISALLTSITIAREKESGTMEQILVSPIRPRQIIIGKVFPYILLAFLMGLVILLIGVFLFHVPFKGNALLLLLLSLLYILTALSLGLLISTVARTQQVAMMIALVATLLPTFLLSGFIFPIASMPKVIQYITYLVPAKYYLFIIRGIILKGSTFFQLLTPSLLLALMSSVLLVIATRKFSINLEK